MREERDRAIARSRRRQLGRRVLATVGLVLGVMAWLSGCPQGLGKPRVPSGAAAAPTSPPVLPQYLPTKVIAQIKGLPCFDCHNVLTGKSAQETPIDFSHARHLTRGEHCQKCHTNPNHSADPKQVAGMRPPMATCVDCHQTAGGPQACAACHTNRSRIQPASHAEEGFIRNHGRLDLSRCTDCHEPVFCSACHVVQVPHPKGWNHGQTALASDQCGKCHPRSTCDNCHGLPMPHPKHFAGTHGALASTQRALCTKCHSRSECQKCHSSQNPHPKDWMKSHGAQASVRLSSCRECHSDESCTACHGVQVPHPDPWVPWHTQAFESKPDTCEKCHSMDGCQNCHDVRGPHGNGWRTSHPQSLKGHEESCAACHPASYC